MKQYNSNHKRFAFVVCCFIVLNIVIVPAEAARGSRVFAITLLASGMGMQVGSTMLNTSAQESYEEYLSATIQADIQTHKNTVIERKNASIIMSRVGLGCVGLAVLLSIIDQLNSSSTELPTSTFSPTNTNVNSLYSTSFTPSRMGLYNGIMREPQVSRFGPHYDFKTQRVSLQFLHRF